MTKFSFIVCEIIYTPSVYPYIISKIWFVWIWPWEKTTSKLAKKTEMLLLRNHSFAKKLSKAPLQTWKLQYHYHFYLQLCKHYCWLGIGSKKNDGVMTNEQVSSFLWSSSSSELFLPFEIILCSESYQVFLVIVWNVKGKPTAQAPVRFFTTPHHHRTERPKIFYMIFLRKKNWTRRIRKTRTESIYK